tara:strand:- start:244 stop:549 length:306 start_codon:yes stop_codon:yes gene_type:complete
MTEKEMNKLADMIVDKLLTRYIDQQAEWYSNSTNDYLNKYFPGINKNKKKKLDTEDELLGELAKLMTKMDYHKQDENYEECAKLKKQIDKINKKLNDLDTN